VQPTLIIRGSTGPARPMQRWTREIVPGLSESRHLEAGAGGVGLRRDVRGGARCLWPV